MIGSTQPYLAFTTRYNGIANRLITGIWLSRAFDPDAASAVDLRDIEKVETRALWDTGATMSVVTPATAQALSLEPIGRALVAHAAGVSEVNKYLVNLYLPNRVGIPGVMVSECAEADGSWGVIIGMDVMGVGDLSITHADGATCMSFRIPSIEGVDYVKMAQQPESDTPRIGRNAPCPCGKILNGRPVKYKNCHGRQPRVQSGRVS